MERSAPMLTIRAEMVDVQFAFEEVPLGGTVGLLALATDANIESDLHRLLPSGVASVSTILPSVTTSSATTPKPVATMTCSLNMSQGICRRPVSGS